MLTKNELMYLLDDRDVREKILSVVNGEENLHADEKLSEREENLSELENLRGENLRLENSLAEAQRQIDYLRQQLQSAQSKNSRLESSLSQSERSSRTLQDKLAEWQRTFSGEQRRANNLQRDLDAAREKISQLTNSVAELEAQNSQRFARGWELFQNYRRVGSHARQLLQGVFPREDFTSFICGGAQTNSLETLWDVLRECVMRQQQSDAEILREVFEYCLELVNASKTQATYSILPASIGDRFDSEIHSEAPGSRAQGKISAVWLPGYRNDYNGRIIRKSVVQVV